MRTFSFIIVTAAALVAASLLGGDLLRSFPTSPAEAGTTEAAGASGPRPEFRVRAVEPRQATAACPFRKTWSLTWDGPRSRWQRACPQNG